MAGGIAFDLTVSYALVAGTAAGLLSLLSWEALRSSPLGRAVFVLTVVMFLFTVYHLLVFVSPSLPQVTVLFKTATLTGATTVVWLLVWSQRRLVSRSGGVSRP